ncbi:hypothetical protein AQUCO_00700138v1 [Aquilegia coerulea]|uniref:Uncharacterized protein n=1 Tax=Aquilegia coerulea TaxID=218851 RepID=A0A2G5EIL8_AQUCA|nr:hypothetical protein AQUCO_00700138v1 [Aquilegia coerulea]
MEISESKSGKIELLILGCIKGSIIADVQWELLARQLQFSIFLSIYIWHTSVRSYGCILEVKGIFIYFLHSFDIKKKISWKLF